MGQKDALLKRYFSDENRFADLINGVIGSGKQLVAAENIMDMDTHVGFQVSDVCRNSVKSEVRRQGKTKYKKLKPKYRDMIRKVAMGMNFVVIGVEEQELTHCVMPVRCMGYDLREYERQVSKVRAQTLKAYEEKSINLSKEEYLSGFCKDDKLYPCITLVLYFGDEWDGATSLHQLLDFKGIPKEFEPFINNYHVYILNVKKLDNTDVFSTDIKLVFDSIRYSNDKECFRKHILENTAYGSLREDAYDVICQYANLKELDGISVRAYDKEGGDNMCKAMQELIEEGREEGRDKMLVSLICKKRKKGLAAEQIAEALEEMVETIREICLAADACGNDEDYDEIYRHWKQCRASN